jgi:tripartite-type tricarboxylate transporter receptor subunit TctC
MYPNKAVRLIVGYPPGGAGDIFGRLVANYLSRVMGQQFVVENRPGAAGTIAAAQVARMPADGYTLYLASAGDFTTARSSFGERLPYNPERDFTHVTLLVKVPLVLVAHPSVPAVTLQEFVAYAQSVPRQLNYASFGNGSTSHLAAEAFKIASGLDIAHVAYKGGSPAVADLIAGRVQIMFDTVLSASRFTTSGQLKSLGVTTIKRVPLMSETPTLAESGLPGFEIATWLGIVAPAGLPSQLTLALARQLDAFTKDQEIQRQLDVLGLLVDGSGPEAFSAFIKQESARMDRLIKGAGIQFD